MRLITKSLFPFMIVLLLLDSTSINRSFDFPSERSSATDDGQQTVRVWAGVDWMGDYLRGFMGR